MSIIGDGAADRQTIATRGHRIRVRPILEGLLDGSHSPDRLFQLLFGMLIGLDNGLAGLAETNETGTVDEARPARLPSPLPGWLTRHRR
jgi:hypothetical protein